MCSLFVNSGTYTFYSTVFFLIVIKKSNTSGFKMRRTILHYSISALVYFVHKILNDFYGSSINTVSLYGWRTWKASTGTTENLKKEESVENDANLFLLSLYHWKAYNNTDISQLLVLGSILTAIELYVINVGLFVC